MYRGRGRGGREKNLDAQLESLAGMRVLCGGGVRAATPMQGGGRGTAAEAERRRTVVGINNMAYMEMAMDALEDVDQLAKRSLDTTRESLVSFPA